MADFQHYANTLSPNVCSVVRPADWRLDAGLVRRIKNAYRLGLENSGNPGSSMWTTTFRKRQQPVHDALMSKDDAVTAAALSNPAQNELYYGMDSIYAAGTQDLKTMDPPRSILVFFILDTLAKLAEAVGARCAWNPEASQKRPTETDIESVISTLDEILGFKIAFPNPFDSEFGVKTSRGIMGQRGPLSLYQAWRSAGICRLIGGNRILEIGAGVGRTAYYARIMGFKDYTIVDLPLGNVGQAVFLGAVLGPDAVWLPGDPVSDQPGRIRILPPGWIKDTSENFDLIVNVDSMTEMSSKQALEYFTFAYEHAQVLLSINHEANPFRVYDLPRMAGLSIQSTRHSCHVRPGYFEECFLNGLARSQRQPPR
jgi:hypothetical protein